MKKLITLIAVILFATTAHAQLSSGLVAWWPFNGNTVDATGNGHNGNPVSIAYGSGRTGTANTAAVFNGTSSFISVPYKSDLNFNKYSICAILKPTGFNTALCQSSRILARADASVPGGYLLELYDNAFDSSCVVTGDTTRFTFNTYSYNNPGHHAPTQYTPSTHTNNWYCVVATWDSVVYKLYVNGVLKYSSNPYSRGPIGSSTDSLSIGASRTANMGTFPYWFNGLIDEIRLYNRALSATEVQECCSEVFIAGNNPNSFCSDQSFNLNYGIIGSFSTGNVFTVELSDATGSFATPKVIGSVTATTAGSIPCVMSASPGTGYKIRVKSSLPAKISDEYSITINNNIPPSVSITANPPSGVGKGAAVTYTAIALNAGTSPAYQWLKNGVPITGATASVFTCIAGIDFLSGDSINVRVKSNNTCASPDSAKSNPIVMDIMMGVNKRTFNNIFYISPNPNKGSFSLKGKIEGTSNIDIQIANTLGQIIYFGNAISQNGSINKEISLNNMSSGIYYVLLHTENDMQILKIMIE